MVNRVVGHGEVLSFRDDYVPVIACTTCSAWSRVHALCTRFVNDREGDGRRVGLFVDDLLGQQQVVINRWKQITAASKECPAQRF